MARAFEFIKDITDRKDLWKVAVKVKDKWSATKDGKEYFEMVVVDAKGDDIFVLVPNELKQKFENEIPIIVKNTYTMQNFQVSKNDDQFKPSHHEFKLGFNGGTLVNDVNVHEIADPVTKFKSFVDIINGNFREDYLYDIIGMVDELGFQQPNHGNRKVQSNFFLRDLSNNLINCTLWENYAMKFFNVQNKANDGPIIVFMKYAKIKAQGKYALNISNTWSTTKLFINDDVPEIIEFKKCLAAGIENGTINAVAETPSQMRSQSSGATQFVPYTPEQKFYYNAEVMPLSKIVQLPQDAKCVTVITTVKIKPSRGGWYYLTCFKCPKQCFGVAPPYKCGDDHETETEIIRYKLDVEVAAGDVKATFVFWDRECAQILGISAADLRAEMLALGINDPLSNPVIMDDIAGKTLDVKLKWQAKWKTGSVIGIHESPEFALDIQSQFPAANVPQGKLQLPAKEANYEDNTSAESSQKSDNIIFPTVSLSASDEVDPDIIDMSTPPKRLGKQLQSPAEIDVGSVIASKASSTKMLKKPKKE
ncbi:uncharacterized protein LOC123885475 isoform X2 [Trifolium pratense]|uniref:uncharacterized protein LOC123885475 isoform X2 n=1 Tax=Trifolium pratense TaxID=57577 RepID=UPI001E698058|nr:uncharacterized protein LOC123885475 isoform X2 [Trifolium pratense]